MKPTEGKGMPVAGAIDEQSQFSPIGKQANGLHIALVWIMAIISIFVLLLFLYVIVRFNKRANPVPSKTSHNTLIEVIWTVVPALILLGIAVPSIGLLSAQYKTPPRMRSPSRRSATSGIGAMPIPIMAISKSFRTC